MYISRNGLTNRAIETQCAVFSDLVYVQHDGKQLYVVKTYKILLLFNTRTVLTIKSSMNEIYIKIKKTRDVRGKNIYTTKTSTLYGCHYHFAVRDR